MLHNTVVQICASPTSSPHALLASALRLDLWWVIPGTLL